MVEWSDAGEDGKTAPLASPIGAEPAWEPRFGRSFFLTLLFSLGAIALLATTIYGYFLVHAHTQSFDRFTDAGRMQQRAMQLSATVVTLDHAERRFIDTGKDDEFDDLHTALHVTLNTVTKVLSIESHREMRQYISQLIDGLNLHHAVIAMALKQSEPKTNQALLAALNPDVLYTPLGKISALAEQASSMASAEFSDTSFQMNLAVAGANASMVICGIALYFLHRRRVTQLAAQREDLTVANNRLQSDAVQHSAKLARTETLLRSTLRASNLTMFIQNTDLVCSWVHNTQAGITSDLIGKRDEDFLPPELWPHTVRIKKEVLASGVGQQVEISYVILGNLVHKWMQIDPIFDQDKVIGLTGMVLDITERRSREIKIGAMAQELVHRNQNLVTVIAAMTRRMAGTSHSLPDFEYRLTGRLQAISSSFDVIIKENWQGASLKELIHAQVALLDPAILDHITLPEQDAIAPPPLRGSYRQCDPRIGAKRPSAWRARPRQRPGYARLVDRNGFVRQKQPAFYLGRR